MATFSEPLYTRCNYPIFFPSNPSRSVRTIKYFITIFQVPVTRRRFRLICCNNLSCHPTSSLPHKTDRLFTTTSSWVRKNSFDHSHFLGFFQAKACFRKVSRLCQTIRGKLPEIVIAGCQLVIINVGSQLFCNLFALVRLRALSLVSTCFVIINFAETKTIVNSSN